MPRMKSFSDKKRTNTKNNLPQLIFPKEAQSQWAQPSEQPRQEPAPQAPPAPPHVPFQASSPTPESAPPMESEWNREPEVHPQIAPEPTVNTAPPEPSQEDLLAQVEASYSAFAPVNQSAPPFESEENPESIDNVLPAPEEIYTPPASGFNTNVLSEESPPVFHTSQPAPTGTALRQARGQIIAAESAFENQNFDVATPLFERILKLLREDSAQNEPEYVSSLQKLGDCYYHVGNFEKALPLYLESSNLPSQRTTTAGPGAIVNLQKLSKTYEKLERSSDAELAGGEAVELANLILPQAHPLLPVVYKSYISLLESTGAPKVKIKTYERELQERMQPDSTTASIPLTENYESDLKAWTNYESFDLEPVKQQHQMQMNKQRMAATAARSRGTHKKPFQLPNLKKVFFIGAAVILVGGMGVAGITALLNTDVSGSKKQMIDARLGPYLGKTFTSADGVKTLVVNKDGTASLTFGENTQSYSCEIGNGAQDMLSTARKLAGAQQDYILKETEQGFEDPSGAIMYSENAEDVKILKAMDKVAELAGFSFSRKKTRYPVKRKDFNDLGPGIELYSPLEIKFSQFDEDEGNTKFTEVLQDMKAGRPLFGPDGKPGVPPSLIECMSIIPFVDQENIKGISFLIRAYNKHGKFITGSDSGSVYVLALKNGVAVPTVEKKDVLSPIKTGPKTIVFLQVTGK